MEVDSTSQGILFSILSESLYADPIGSLIRELVTNAFDSHAEAGVKDVPVLVGFSNDSREQFIVQDFGTGLSPERVESIYSKYLSSSKRDTNDQHGYFGLGSKSPLAYADSFMIETIYDKTKYLYLMSKGIDATELTLLNKETDDKHDRNGTKIIVNIKSGDTYKFTEAMRAQLAYFHNIKFTTFTGLRDDYEIFQTKHFSFSGLANSNSLQVLLGRVAYTLRPSEFPEETYPDMNFDFPIALNFEIGDLPVTPSREDIRYIGDVKEKIYEKFLKAQKDILERISKQFDYDNPTDLFKNHSVNTKKVALQLSDNCGFLIPEEKISVKYKGELIKISKINKALGFMLELRGSLSNERFSFKIYSPSFLNLVNECLIRANKGKIAFTKQFQFSKINLSYAKHLSSNPNYSNFYLLRRKQITFRRLREWVSLMNHKKEKALYRFINDVLDEAIKKSGGYIEDLDIPKSFIDSSKLKHTKKLEEDEVIFYIAELNQHGNISYRRRPVKLNQLHEDKFFLERRGKPFIVGSYNNDESVLDEHFRMAIIREEVLVLVTAGKNLKSLFNYNEKTSRFNFYTLDEFMEFTKPLKRSLSKFRFESAISGYNLSDVESLDKTLSEKIEKLKKKYSEQPNVLNGKIILDLIQHNNNADELYDPIDLHLIKEIEKKLKVLSFCKITSFNTAVSKEEKKRILFQVARALKYRMHWENYVQF